MCTSGCPTQNHKSWGECLRAKNLVVNYTNAVGTQKYLDDELSRYQSAVKNGIEPRSTKMKDIVAAERLSDSAGKAFDGISLDFKS
jgi:hypothetical protein